MTKKQIDIIKAFLGRTNLQGSEVPVFIDILRALDEEDKPETKETKKEK